MPPAKQLTQRDMELLRYLAKCSVLTLGQAKRIYGNTEQYHYRRLKCLEERGYVRTESRYSRYIEATKLGIKEAGYDHSPPRLRDKDQCRHKARVAEICLGLPNWEYLSPREVKQSTTVNKSYRLDGLLRKDGKEYVVYLLSDDPRRTTIQGIKHELNDMPYHRIYNAIVFCPTLKAMEHFYIDIPKLEELLLLPYPYGIELLRHKDEIEGRIEDLLRGYEKANRRFADYQKGQTYVSVLAFNDVVKKEQLEAYLKLRDREKKDVEIVCLESQSRKLTEQFPGVKLITIPELWRDKNA
ncbi:hypothetical protein Desku_0894 [Desulfofundulus kuznetsovii DSM 6115]|uniref:Replication-relaxation n=1 Tax=Desulfofundulus kuznetsovii (strain DSM 6115 / VKM B-1805 / 17) TaxID=760568 RepID=A0AAU8P981_DESK7|nr:hypothetical protein Desku_0894 [Desulfofundulus kuznetsovii DSM 6115]